MSLHQNLRVQMTLYLTLFSLVLMGSGAYRLYLHFTTIGSVTSAGEVINSYVLTSIFILIAGLGLFLKRSWGRLATMGLSLVGVGATIYGVTYVALNFRQFAAALAFLMIFLQTLPVFMHNMIGYIVTGLTAALFSGGLFLLAFLQLRKPDAIFFYDDRLWFGRQFAIKDFDLRPLVFSAVFLFTFYVDKMLPRNFSRELDKKEFAHTAKEIKKELEKDPAYVKKQEEARLYAEKVKDDSQSTHHLRFTNDDTKIWAVTADKKVHLVDLLQYKEKEFEFGDFHQGRLNHLAPDGAYFFDPNKKAFIQTSDSTPIPISPGSAEVLGFGVPSTRVLIYTQETRKISFIDIKTQQVLWSLDWETGGSPNQAALNGVFWSADRNVALLAPSKGFFILNLQTGKFEAADLKFRYPEFNFSDAKSGKMTVSGPVGFNQNDYKTYFIDTKTGTFTELASTEAIIGFDPMTEVFIAKSLNKVKLLKMALPTEVVRELDAGYWPVFLKAPAQPWILSIRDQDNQVSFTNTESGQKKNIGRVFPDNRKIEDRVTKQAVSPSGALWAIAVRNKFEVFWTSELTKDTPRSWAFEMKIEPSKR